jgi:hypothetical protein
VDFLCAELCPAMTDNIENKEEILITPVSKADINSAYFREFLQREISCTEFHPNC